MMFPVQLIVNSPRVVYENSCPFLTINPPFDRKKRPRELSEYIVQFWRSRNKNKNTAQHLVTAEELLREIQKYHPDIAVEVVSSVISTLTTVDAFWQIEVDTRGSNVKKLLVAPLGLALWWSIDDGILPNQKPISQQYVQQILNEDILKTVLRAENKAWLEMHQEGLAVAEGAIDSRAVCLGMFLLLNGAIAQDHALHLVRTSNKDFQGHNTLTKGLNEVAQILFGEKLFTIPSLKDDLQRRKELLKKVGSSFNWPKPTKGVVDEYYWWEIGEYNHDLSILNYIVRSLVRSIPTSEDLPQLESRVEKLVNYFMHKVGYQLDAFDMSDLFPKQPSRDFNYELQASIKKALSETALESNVILKDKVRKKRTKNTQQMKPISG